jgi:hypothetical protein
MYTDVSGPIMTVGTAAPGIVRHIIISQTSSIYSAGRVGKFLLLTIIPLIPAGTLVLSSDSTTNANPPSPIPNKPSSPSHALLSMRISTPAITSAHRHQTWTSSSSATSAPPAASLLPLGLLRWL